MIITGASLTPVAAIASSVAFALLFLVGAMILAISLAATRIINKISTTNTEVIPQYENVGHIPTPRPVLPPLPAPRSQLPPIPTQRRLLQQPLNQALVHEQLPTNIRLEDNVAYNELPNHHNNDGDVNFTDGNNSDDRDVIDNNESLVDSERYEQIN